MRDVPERYQALYERTQAGMASPRQAIKMQCLECVSYDQDEVKACTDTGCPLYLYRPGKARATSSQACRRAGNTDGLCRWRESRATAKANALPNGPSLADRGPERPRGRVRAEIDHLGG
jgi:hypothetical protein